MPELKIEKCFNGLPIELRLQIWKKAAFIPRNVDVWNKEIFISDQDEARAYAVPYRMISRTPPPAILHVCRESRNEGLKHYMLEFGTTKDVGEFVVTSKPKIYINPVVDTLCLPRPFPFLHYSITSDLRLEKMKLRSLAINVYKTPQVGLEGDTYVSMFGQIMPIGRDSIEELILYSDAEDYNYGDHESRPLYDRYDMVNFRKFSHELHPCEQDQEDLGVEETMTELIEGSELLDAYFVHYDAFDFTTPDMIERYHTWKKTLCKMIGRWEDVDE